MSAFIGEVYMSVQPSFQVEIWARGRSKFTTALGPHYSDQRVITFDLGQYTAQDPEEEWFIEHHPQYGQMFLNKRVWEASPETRQKMQNMNKSGMAASSMGADMPLTKNTGANLRIVNEDQKVGCPYCQNYVERGKWIQHRDLFHKDRVNG